MRLFLVRHPQPLVATSVCYGSSDIAADPHDLLRVYQALRDSFPSDAALYTSPLRRCTGLAQQLVGHLACGSLISDVRLAEMHFGAWELCSWDDIPRAEIDAWAADITEYRPGGGESVMQMAARVHAFYAEVLVRQKDCVVICHAGTIRMLLACRAAGKPDVRGIAQQAAQNTMKIAYGQMMVI